MEKPTPRRTSASRMTHPRLRRALVHRAALAGIALPALGTWPRSVLARQDATPSSDMPDFSGETLRFMIIQPHAPTDSPYEIFEGSPMEAHRPTEQKS